MADDNPFRNFSAPPRANPTLGVANPFEGFRIEEDPEDKPLTTQDVAPPPMSWGRSVLGVPYAAARGVYGGTVGFFPDIANAFGAAKHFLGTTVPSWMRPAGTKPPEGETSSYVPYAGGSDEQFKKVDAWLKDTFGIDMSTPTGAEKAAEVIGSFMGPGLLAGPLGAFLKETSLAAKAPAAIGTVRRGIGATQRGIGTGLEVVGGTSTANLAQGIGGAGGGELAETLFPNSPTARTVGTLAGSLGTGLAHGGLEYGRNAAMPQRTFRLAKSDLDLARDNLERTKQAGKALVEPEADRLFNLHQQKSAEVRAAEHAADIRTRAELGQEQGLTNALAVENTRLAQMEEASKQAMDMTKTRAERDAATLKARTLRAEIDEATLRGQEGTAIAGTPQALAPIVPSTEVVGAGESAQAGLAARGTQQAADRLTTGKQEFGQLKADIGPETDPAGLIDLSRADYRPQYQAAQQRVGDILDRAEGLLGEQRVVQTTGFRTRLKDLYTEAIGANKELPAQLYQWAEDALPQMQLTKGQKAKLASLRNKPNERGLYLLSLTPADHAISIKDARAIQRELGAGGRGDLTGTMPQGRQRMLDNGLSDDMNKFFDNTRPIPGIDETQAAKVGAELAKGKAEWKNLRTTFSESILGDLLDNRAGDKAYNFISFLHGITPKTMPDLDRIWKLASPETKEAISHHMAAHIGKRAEDTAGNLVGSKLDKEILHLQQQGTWDVYFTPDQQKRMLDIKQNLLAQDPTIEVTMRKAVAKMEPEKVPAFVFAPGEYSRTAAFKRMSPTAAYDESRSAWSSELLRQTPQKQAETLAEMAAPKQGGKSQLDIMFEDQPQVAADLKRIVTEHTAEPQRTAAAAQRTLGAKKLEQQSIERWEGELARVEALHQPRIDAANIRVQEATERLTAAEGRTKAMRERGTAEVGQVGESRTIEIEKAQRDVRDAKKVAQRANTAASKAKQNATRHLAEAKAKLQTGKETRMLIVSGGLTSALTAALTGNVRTGLATAATTLGLAGLERGAQALAKSPRIQDWAHAWQPTHYSPSAARFALQVSGQEAGRGGAPGVDIGREQPLTPEEEAMQ